MAYAGQLKIPRMQPTNINSSPRMQRPPQVYKSVPNVVSTESHASGATNDPASLVKELQHPIQPQQPFFLYIYIGRFYCRKSSKSRT